MEDEQEDLGSPKTVGELLEILKKLPPEMRLVVNTGFVGEIESAYVVDDWRGEPTLFLAAE